MAKRKTSIPKPIDLFAPRDYAGDSCQAFGALPFLKRTPRRGVESHWHVEPIADYGEARAAGAALAAHYLQYLKAKRPMSGMLASIARDIDFNDEARKGQWVGFFAHLERYLVFAVQQVDVFEDLRIECERWALIEAKRKSEIDAVIRARVKRMNAARRAKRASLRA